MRSSGRTQKLTEKGALGVIALVCYSTAITAMLVFGYTVLTLALRALGHDFAFLLSPAGV